MTDFPRISSSTVPWLTTDQMIEVDRVMIEDLRIELPQMMENAGRNLALVGLELFRPERVVVLAGSGGNGGGGLVAARHLANRGISVTVVVSRPADEFWGVPAHQLDICQRMGIRVVDLDAAPIAEADMVIDALIGYSLRGAPRGVPKTLIEGANASAASVLSLDVPSGVDSSTGDRPGVAIDAQATLTLAAPKIGLRDNDCVGRLFVGDISVPPSVYAGLGFDADPIFAVAPIIEISAD